MELSSADLNDFITPAPECVKPVEFRRSHTDAAAIEIGPDGAVREDNTALPVAQISLTDCLACSGCITSAESVLVEQQSVSELRRFVRSGTNSALVLSVAPQCRVSLAHGLGLTVDQVDARLRYLFRTKLGFSHIVGTEIGRAVALEETVGEVLDPSRPEGQPVIASVCPGWACYAEKSKPEILPLLSHVRSPQQITGHLLKRAILDVQPGTSIYHVSVMPCFDKKLEAARPEFSVDGQREVDLVLAAKEILDLARDECDGTEFADIPEQAASTEDAPKTWPGKDSWMSNRGSSSGGYLQHVVDNICRQHDGKATVHTIRGRNRDVIEHVVVDAAGRPVFRGAQVYGFRNIQNTVRKLKPRHGHVRRRATAASNPLGGADPHDWHYIEMMACPGGCGSGGGQLPPAPDLQSEYDNLDKLEVTSGTVEQYLGQLGVERTPQLVNVDFHAVKQDAQAQPLALSAEW